MIVIPVGAQRGQVVPIVALGMVVFIGFLGLALDGGSAYLQQRSLQRAADLAALAAASTYYRSNYAGSANAGYPASVSTGVTGATAAATTVVIRNGYPASVQATPVLLDHQGNALASQCSPTCPGSTAIRGFSISLTTTAATNVMRAAGFNQTTVAASARAMITVPGGAAREGPLLLQNYSDLLHFVPRNSAYTSALGPCATTPADGIQYGSTPDCRPQGSATPAVLVPAAETLPPVLGGTFAAAQKVYFYVIHDPPDQGSAGGAYPSFSTSDARAATVSGGEGDTRSFTIPTCPPSSLGTPCATSLAYAELAHTDSLGVMLNDNVATGINARIAAANVSPWSSQDCSRPAGGLLGVNPLTPDNPRLMRLPLHYPAPLSGASNVASFRVSETVMFCAQYLTLSGPGSTVPQSGNNYAVTGYLVNVADTAATTVATPGPYFGQDVLIRLLS